MSQPLPISDYEWVTESIDNQKNDDITTESSLYYDVNAILNLSDDAENGYLFEVDLDYPENLHDAHNDFPFCPEKRTLPDEVVEILNKKNNKIEKLLLTLYAKEKYILHYRMLKMVLRHGLILKKVHRILKFKQSTWLKPYIEMNTKLRTKATNEFEKSMQFSVKRWRIYALGLTLDWHAVWLGRSGARLLIARSNFKRLRIFDEDLVAIEMKKTRIKMTKPIIVGMCVLDVSKITMYSFLYDFLKPKYGKNCEICYSDTDSFILSVETDDFYRDMQEHIYMFDTSDYPWPNIYNIERKNKKIPGLFKDELNGEIVLEFVGIRAKSYALRSAFNEKEFDMQDDDIYMHLSAEERMERHIEAKTIIKKSKGVKKCALKSKIKFQDYIDCVKKQSIINTVQNTIQSRQKKIRERRKKKKIQQKKIALSPFDDKRYIISSEHADFRTLAWGHYALEFYRCGIL